MAFRGHEIINGKESDIPKPDQGFLDEYSRTKYEAEQMVLKRPSTTTMRKTILRLGGVFGPNEKAMLPRSITAIKSGLLNLAYCLKSDLKIDLVHIDNVVQAHVKVSGAFFVIETRSEETIHLLFTGSQCVIVPWKFVPS